MAVAHLHCPSGIAGDMFVGALLDAGADFEALRQSLSSLPLENYSVNIDEVRRCGFRASWFRVFVDQDQPARTYDTVRTIVSDWQTSTAIRDRALAIFDALANAESRVHGVAKAKVHFHEVGAVDSIIDVCAAAWCLDALRIDRMTCSPINVGSGNVATQHGVLGVPAPATLELLHDVPIYADGEPTERTTPTGAAIVRTMVSTFGDLPRMTLTSHGAGAGSRELGEPNLLRISIGETADGHTGGWSRDEVEVLETHLDDVSGELLGFVSEKLFEAGALDVAHTGLTMKKGRPGSALTVIAEPHRALAIAEIIARETGTLGIRRRRESRLKLSRELHALKTRFGSIEAKFARLGDDLVQITPEYDSCAAMARQQGVPLREVYDSLREAAAKLQLPLNGRNREDP